MGELGRGVWSGGHSQRYRFPPVTRPDSLRSQSQEAMLTFPTRLGKGGLAPTWEATLEWGEEQLFCPFSKIGVSESF